MTQIQPHSIPLNSKEDFYKKTRVAIVHDFMICAGGADRHLVKLAGLFEKVDIYSLYSNPNPETEFIQKQLKNRSGQPIDIKQTLPKSLPFKKQFFRFFEIPTNENLNLSNYDLVITHTARFGKGLVLPVKTKAIYYILTPPRPIWHLASARPKLLAHLLKPFVYLLYHYWRLWDSLAMRRADLILTLSTDVKKKIKKFYGLASTVLFPMVDDHQIQTELEKAKANSSINQLYSQIIKKPNQSYFMTLHRLDLYKKTDLAIRTWVNYPRAEKLLIVGQGLEYKNLVKLTENLTKQKPQIQSIDSITITDFNQIKFIQGASDSLVYLLLSKSLGLINCNREDFGINMVEALATGTPVIAYHKGGAEDIIKHKKTGWLFSSQTPAALSQALDQWLKLSQKGNSKNIYTACLAQAKQFNQTRFARNLFTMVKSNLSSPNY